MHFSLVKFSLKPLSSYGLDDIILPVFFALQRLGYKTELLVNACNPASCNIIFGSCQAPRHVGRRIPHNSIIYNVEQVFNQTSIWNNSDYFAHLSDYTVWEYSKRNIAALTQQGITNIVHVPFGYVEEMHRIEPVKEQDIDILFYGSINERRHKIIQKLLGDGIKIIAGQSFFGKNRDTFLARAKCVLNVHFYMPAILETIRLGYVFSNHIPVVSEWRDDTEIPDHLQQSCAFFPYDALVEGIKEFIHDESARQLQADKAFTAFSSQSYTKILENILGKRTHAVCTAPTQTIPEWLIPYSPNISNKYISIEKIK